MPDVPLVFELMKNRFIAPLAFLVWLPTCELGSLRTRMYWQKKQEATCMTTIIDLIQRDNCSVRRKKPASPSLLNRLHKRVKLAIFETVAYILKGWNQPIQLFPLELQEVNLTVIRFILLVNRGSWQILCNATIWCLQIWISVALMSHTNFIHFTEWD